MTDKLLQVFSKVRQCGCGCKGIELMPHFGESYFIAPYGAGDGRDPGKFLRVTEEMHKIVVEELWRLREGFLE